MEQRKNQPQEEKKRLRQEILTKRDKLSASERKAYGRAALVCLKQEEVFLQASVVYLYLSIGSELPTGPILAYCLQAGKTVAAPKVSEDKKTMNFYPIRPNTVLVPGRYGIPEPKEENPIVSPGVMLLPGLLFDTEKNRLGYGGGFYDRYLSQFPENHFYKIAVIYPFQLIDRLPASFQDKKVDQIITVDPGCIE